MKDRPQDLSRALPQFTENAFRQFLEAVPDGLIIVNPRGEIQFINKQVETMFGYLPEELLGKAIELLIPNRFNRHKGHREAYLDHPRTGSMGNGLVSFATRKDQTEFQAEISLSPLEFGGETYIIAAVRDVTAIRRMESELQSNLTRYYHMLDNMLEGCQIIDFDWRYIYINNAAAKQGRRRPDELLMHTMMEVYPGIENTELFTVLRQCMEQRIRHKMENQFDNPDGTTGWFELNIEPVPEGIFILSMEITERKLAEQRIQKQLSSLTALREIDLAILSSFSLKFTLDVALKQIVAHLQVDAANIMILDPSLNTLNYAAGIGFRTQAIQEKSIHIGENFIGPAILDQRVIQIDNLKAANGFVRSELCASEGFTCYFCAPMIVKGKIRGVLEIFNRLPIEPDPEWLAFIEVLTGQTALAIDNSTLFSDLERSNAELMLAYETTLEGWSAALDLRDKETEGHTQRVTTMCLELAKAMGMMDEELVHVRRGALLHDIGKMGVPDHILLKPGELSEEEWKQMRMHPVYAYDMLSRIVYLHKSINIPYCHHEKWDGTGYPRGLKGQQIPLAARVFAVVDVWDAITSDRPYRPAWPKPKALQHIRELSGLHFDPNVVEVFLSMVEAFDNLKPGQ